LKFSHSPRPTVSGSIALEEMGLDYRSSGHLRQGEQKTEAFRAMIPRKVRFLSTVPPSWRRRSYSSESAASGLPCREDRATLPREVAHAEGLRTTFFHAPAEPGIPASFFGHNAVAATAQPKYAPYRRSTGARRAHHGLSITERCGVTHPASRPSPISDGCGVTGTSARHSKVPFVANVRRHLSSTPVVRAMERPGACAVVRDWAHSAVKQLRRNI